MSGTELVRYDAMCHAIQAAYEVDEVKDIRDKALAFEYYARQSKNTEAERQACEIRLRAERKAGQLSAKLPTSQGQRSDLTSSHDGTKSSALEKAGISRRQAAQWEQLADIPDHEFETALNGQEKPTTAGIIAQHQVHGKPRDKVDPGALWLWGRLQDFERDGLLSRDPGEMLDTMLDHMRETTLRLAPLVASWLQRM